VSEVDEVVEELEESELDEGLESPLDEPPSFLEDPSSFFDDPLEDDALPRA
jgi:hypothetical protein